jgi:hypothetical protein
MENMIIIYLYYYDFLLAPYMYLNKKRGKLREISPFEGSAIPTSSL